MITSIKSFSLCESGVGGDGDKILLHKVVEKIKEKEPEVEKVNFEKGN